MVDMLCQSQQALRKCKKDTLSVLMDSHVVLNSLIYKADYFLNVWASDPGVNDKNCFV